MENVVFADKNSKGHIWVEVMKGPVCLFSLAVATRVKRFAGPEAERGHECSFVQYQLQILVTRVS